MLLQDFITINESGSIETVVNLDMMDDPDKNLKLCQGFVFNYNSDRPKESTVGLLDILRRSYHSPNSPNIHCVVQDYGKGKTHFALTIANFFGKPYDSPEVKGIFNSIKIATGEKNKAVCDTLESFKSRSKHLVLCLRGDKATDLRKHFLDAVLKALNKEGLTSSIAHHLCLRPLQYLEQLSDGDRVKGDRYLRQIDAQQGDIEAICELLRNNNHEVIPLVIKVADTITNGFAPNFIQNIEIEEILDDLVKNLCTGSNARFQGILILFDELNNYLDSWLTDKYTAGNTAPQNLTNACDNNKAKIALISFTQVNPNSKSNRDGYQQVSTRLARFDDTHTPVSSLERVIDDVIVHQDNEAWKAFREKWDNVFVRDSERIYNRARKYQDGNNLTEREFYEHLGLGCFPLHSFAGYLLCNLEFTQGRTAIEFIRKEIKEFLNNPPEIDRSTRLNYLYATSLVDAFAPNFKVSASKAALYENYTQTLESIVAENDNNEINVVKAIFLYNASSDLLIKQANDSHEEILCDLTGLSKLQLEETLKRLINARQAVYRRNDGIYQFFTGTNPRELEQRVIAELEERGNQQLPEIAFVEYCRENINKVFSEEAIKANSFAAENGLLASDWCFKNQIFTINDLENLLNSAPEIVKARIKKVRDNGYHGIVAFVIASNSQDLDALWDEIDSQLQKSPIHQRLVVAIAKQGIGEGEQNLGRILQKINILKAKFKSEQGTASYTKLLTDWETYLRDRTHEIINRPDNLRHHSTSGHKLTLQSRKYATDHVSALLSEIYPFVPSIDGVDKLSIFPRIHPTGNKIAATVASQVLAGKGKITAASLPKEASYTTAIDNAFVKSWKIFKKTPSEYVVQEPTDQKVRDAWDRISQLCVLNGEKCKEISLSDIWQTLADAPYGYNLITFTVLLASWLSFHREEVALRGITDLKSKTYQSMQTKGLEEWAAANILEKADVFVDKWIVKSNARLIRRERIAAPKLPDLPTSYEQVIAYLERAKDFLGTNSNTSEANEVTEWQPKLEKIIKDFNNWFRPIQEAAQLSLDTPIEKVVQLYPQALRECHVIEIDRTSSQNELQYQALKRLQQILEERVRVLQVETESLNTIQDCVTNLSNIEAAIRSLHSVTALPDCYAQSMEQSKAAIVQRQKTIETHEKITQKLREVQSRYEGLSQNATQQELTEAQVAIVHFAEALPALTNESKYLETLQNISDRQEELRQQLQKWDSRYLSPEITKPEATELLVAISKQENRYTDPSDKQRLQDISHSLNQIIQGIEGIENIKKNNTEVIQQAEKSIKQINDSNSIGTTIESYKQLLALQILTHPDLNVENLHTQLASLKAKGYEALINKLTQSINRCDNQISKREEYTQSSGLIQLIQKLLPNSPEFDGIRTQLELASTNLKQRLQEFEQRTKDFNIVEQIKRLPLSSSHTVKQCEDSLNQIQSLLKNLNDRDIYQADIDKRIADFIVQIAKQCEEIKRLQIRIEAIADPRELDSCQRAYDKLELIFKDSSHYISYQQLQTKIDELKDDLDAVRELEKLKQKSNSIVECQNSQQKLAEASKTIADRFQPKIQEINQYLSDRIDQYHHELEDLEQRLTTITGSKQCQSLEAELSRKFGYYIDSEISENQYRQIQTQLSRLQVLYKLADAAKLQTLDDYDLHLQTLQQWLDEDSQTPEWMRDRHSTIRRDTEKNRQALLDKIRKEAREWLNLIDRNWLEVDTDSNTERQAENAHKLIQSIKNEKPDFVLGLNEDLENTIEEIERKCNSIIESSLEIQIISRFRQLPQSHRHNLYTRLQQYLTDRTEDV
jgi:DNA repair exonuclease SbcCD ATPase subunit